MLKFINILFVMLSTGFALGAIENRVEDGLAITHPRVLRTLQQRANGMGIGLGYYLDPTGLTSPYLSNQELAELAPFKVLMNSIEDEIAIFKKENEHPKWNTIGVGVRYHSRLFDMNFLKDDRAVFALIGVVNRMDKAFESPETCGETRLIFRLSYRVELGSDKSSVASRLPFTMNLILNTKSPDSPLTCQEIAQRWKNLDIQNLTVSQAVDQIFGADGVLSPELRDRNLLKGVEINLQLARQAAAVRPDFGGHAVYLLKAFEWNHISLSFSEIPLKNQIDRKRAEDFFSWFLSPDLLQENLRNLDAGTLLVPDEFLAYRAYSIAPGGLARSQNHPLIGKVPEQQIADILNSNQNLNLHNLKSVEGFKRRLTDLSCTGCHQTRAIGGFHFMGEDPKRWSNKTESFEPVFPGNSVVVPASGHFFADLERRRQVQTQMVSGENVNFGSGFASKPFQDSSSDKANLGIFNGWGSHCYLGDDPSFNSWQCSEGLKCLELYDAKPSSKFGVCISETGTELGDPTEVGVVKKRGGPWFSDRYERSDILFTLDPEEYVNSPQSPLPGTKTGGFPGGSIRGKSCSDDIMSEHPEALCGSLPAGGNGFNKCIFDPNRSFSDCVSEFSTGVALRGCSRQNPCRDDYICVQSQNEDMKDAGVCVPPYFLFQFRVDGHPIKF